MRSALSAVPLHDFCFCSRPSGLVEFSSMKRNEKRKSWVQSFALLILSFSAPVAFASLEFDSIFAHLSICVASSAVTPGLRAHAPAHSYACTLMPARSYACTLMPARSYACTLTPGGHAGPPSLSPPLLPFAGPAPIVLRRDNDLALFGRAARNGRNGQNGTDCEREAANRRTSASARNLRK